MKVRAGQCTVTTWKNIKEINGNKVEVFNATTHRSYKKDDAWENTNSYPIEQIPKLISALQRTYDNLVLKEEKEETQKEEIQKEL